MKQILLVIFFFSLLLPVFGNELKSDTSQIPLPTGGVSHPIRFLTFSAVRIQENINIQFSTPSESITSNYYLERSQDGIDWEIVATIPTLSNLNTINKYYYTDLNIKAKIIYYRVKQVWQNGVYSYSPIVYAKIKSLNEKIMISGQPGNAIAIYFPEEIKGTVNVQIRNLNGQMLMNQILSKPAGHVLLQTAMINRGMLVVSLSDGEMIQMAKTVLLQ
jgi:hypothetical protein